MDDQEHDQEDRDVEGIWHAVDEDLDSVHLEWDDFVGSWRIRAFNNNDTERTLVFLDREDLVELRDRLNEVIEKSEPRP